MTLEGFWNSLGDFPSNMAGDSDEALTLWNREVGWAIDTIPSRCCCLVNGAQRAPCLTEELWAIKQLGHHLE